VSYVDSPEGLVTPTEVPRFPVPGAVSRILVVPGQRVDAGDMLMVLDAAPASSARYR
jgi:acyl-CoA carboxylase subunit alpha